jgi:hypothetical protein
MNIGRSMACPPVAAKYSDDRKVWTDTAEVKNKASGPADRRWAIHPQGSALSILDFFQSVLPAAGRPKRRQLSLSASGGSKTAPPKRRAGKTKKYC